MRLIKVKGPTVREALARVRSRFGPGALVLEVRRRGDEIEALVAAETELSADVRTAAARGAIGAIQSIGSPAGALARGEDPAVRTLRISLERGGWLSSVARDLAAGAAGRRDVLIALRDTVRSRVRTVDLAGSREPVVLIGAEGSGKSTAAAMLAAHAALSLARPVLLLELGPAARPNPLLAACARLLGGRHAVAASAGEAARFVATSGDALVIVDLNGARPLLAGEPELLRRLTSAIGAAHLILAAAAESPLLLQAQIRALGAPLLAGVGLTRTDAAGGTLGACLSSLMEHGVQPAFFTSGTEIPQALAPATPESVAAFVLRSVTSRENQRVTLTGGHAAAQEIRNV